MEQAEVLELADALTLDGLLKRYPRRKGSKKVRAILEQQRIGLTLTRSELEERFLAWLQQLGLPLPLCNQIIEGFEVDCVWPEQRVIVELDGRAAHDTAAAFERDRVKDRALAVAGWHVVRVTWRQLHEDAPRLERDLRRLLA
jgi:hypothetical protein